MFESRGNSSAAISPRSEKTSTRKRNLQFLGSAVSHWVLLSFSKTYINIVNTKKLFLFVCLFIWKTGKEEGYSTKSFVLVVTQRFSITVSRSVFHKCYMTLTFAKKRLNYVPFSYELNFMLVGHHYESMCPCAEKNNDHSRTANITHQ